MTETERIVNQVLARREVLQQAELAVVSTENAYIAAQKKADRLLGEHKDRDAYIKAEDEARRLCRAAMDAYERSLAMKGIDASLQEEKP